MIAALLLVVATAAADPAARERALAELAGPKGPARFAQVSDHLFRGGQPTAHQLELLRRLGVDNVIDLRQLHGELRRAEAREAERLGMTFHSFPFNATFGADVALLKQIAQPWPEVF